MSNNNEKERLNRKRSSSTGRTGNQNIKKKKNSSQEKDTMYKDHSVLQEYCLSNYDPNKFLELVKLEEINIHPKNEFIGILKAFNDNFKNKKQILLNLRKYLYEQVVLMFYSEIDVYLYSGDYINNVIHDIYLLTMAFIEENLVDSQK